MGHSRHWTQVTQVWGVLGLCGGEKGWVIYPETDFAQESECVLTPLHGEAAGSTALAPSVAEAADTPQNAGSPTFEQTGDPLLLIGRDSSRLRQRDRQVFFDMRSFQ